eukprot:NODE_3827_length_725_cov_557.578402_g3227_i0.p1 GENE.NODE_3827_length_725_cov_557.578402_g3227_i0~~NODE_3827_length_725_cov_557.578402_g3227_i0.p1  ORF type:complete len:213 (+),score=66.81 NODE_3827_length_725_cov_557.578402_g3227_i0:3-641(+)
MKIGSPIAQLPKNFRPPARQTFCLSNNQGNKNYSGEKIRVDVLPNGNIIHVGKPPRHWTSLAGIHFDSNNNSRGGVLDGEAGNGALVKGNRDMTKCQQNVCKEIKQLQKQYHKCKDNHKKEEDRLVRHRSKKRTCVLNKNKKATELEAQVKRLQGQIKILHEQSKDCTRAIKEDDKAIKAAKGEGAKCHRGLRRENENADKFNCKGSWRDAK